MKRRGWAMVAMTGAIRDIGREAVTMIHAKHDTGARP
jgi:hypothetical protein